MCRQTEEDAWLTDRLPRNRHLIGFFNMLQAMKLDLSFFDPPMTGPPRLHSENRKRKFFKTMFPLTYRVLLTVLIACYDIKLQWEG